VALAGLATVGSLRKRKTVKTKPLAKIAETGRNERDPRAADLHDLTLPALRRARAETLDVYLLSFDNRTLKV